MIKNFIIIFLIFLIELDAHNYEYIDIIHTLMKRNNIPLLQFAYFNTREYHFYQWELKENYEIITNQDLSSFLVGEIAYPLINDFVSTLDEEKLIQAIKKSLENQFLQEIYNNIKKENNYIIYKYNLLIQKKEDIILEKKEKSLIISLQNMLSGLEISRAGIFFEKNPVQNSLVIREKPFLNFYLSTNNYLLLKSILDLYFNESAISHLNQYLKSQSMKNSYFYEGNIEDLIQKNQIVRGSFSGKKIEYIKPFTIKNPLSFGLITNVKDYYRFINQNKNIFSEFYTYYHLVGGYKEGFFYRKSCDLNHYIAESYGILPGILTYVFLLDNGSGFILFQAGDDEKNLYLLREIIGNILFKESQIRCEFGNFENPELKGDYIGMNLLPAKKELFSDFYIRKDYDNFYKVYTFFSTKEIGKLYFLKENLIFLDSLSRLGGNFFVFKDDYIYSGIYKFKKLNWSSSLRGGIVIFSIIFLLLFLILSGFFIFRRSLVDKSS